MGNSMNGGNPIHDIVGAVYYGSGVILQADLGPEELVDFAMTVHEPSGLVYFFSALTLLYTRRVFSWGKLYWRWLVPKIKIFRKKLSSLFRHKK